MPVAVVIDGMYGSCGKGKVVDWIARQVGDQIGYDKVVGIKVGGLNAGHIVHYQDGTKYTYKQLPSVSHLKGATSIVASGALVNLDILKHELEDYKLDPTQVVIDPLATILEQRHIDEEKAASMSEKIGSTCSGTGAAFQERMRRDGKAVLVRDRVAEITALGVLVADTKPILNDMIRDQNHYLIVEGTQGFGLSCFHSDAYPKATGRDTTAAQFLADAGISPLDCNLVCMVLRSYPIRVAGDSGPLKGELSWDELTKISGSAKQLHEITTVTKKTRRVGAFDAELVRRAIWANRPNCIVMNHLDYIDPAVRDASEITPIAAVFVADIEKQIGQKIDMVGISEWGMLERYDLPKAKPQAAE